MRGAYGEEGGQGGGVLEEANLELKVVNLKPETLVLAPPVPQDKVSVGDDGDMAQAAGDLREGHGELGGEPVQQVVGGGQTEPDEVGVRNETEQGVEAAQDRDRLVVRDGEEGQRVDLGSEAAFQEELSQGARLGPGSVGTRQLPVLQGVL